MKRYKPIRLSTDEQRIKEQLELHVRDMFPTNHPPGHDWQHVDTQMRLWSTVGGSVLEENQFAGRFDPFLPFLYIPGHDLNRLPIFEPMGRSLKKKTDGLGGEAFEQAKGHNARIDAFNHRASVRLFAIYDGLLQYLGVPGELRGRITELIDEIGGPNRPHDPADLIVCSDLDKAVTGHIYAWRCACVGTGVRVNHVAKNYLVAPITGSTPGPHVLDEQLSTWVDDLEWAEDWDPCVARDPLKFVIRSAVLHEFADPGFAELRRVRSETLAHLRAIGYDV